MGYFRIAASLPNRMFYLVLASREHDLVANPFHVFEQDLLAAAVIEFGGPAVGVAGDSLRGFKGTVIFEKIRDAGGPE